MKKIGHISHPVVIEILCIHTLNTLFDPLVRSLANQFPQSCIQVDHLGSDIQTLDHQRER